MTVMNEPLVSICCITYNHEPYIRDAIEGFLMQKTNFPFEILIHDDASTDGTADIIREYEAKISRYYKTYLSIGKSTFKRNWQSHCNNIFSSLWQIHRLMRRRRLLDRSI